MNQKELRELAKYHKEVARVNKQMLDHHLKKAEGYLKRANALRTAAAKETAKKMTEDILGRLSEQTSRE